MIVLPYDPATVLNLIAVNVNVSSFIVFVDFWRVPLTVKVLEPPDWIA